ncbi:MAG: hypothetical protein AAF586_09675 [Planctomycetota bacterium]
MTSGLAGLSPGWRVFLEPAPWEAGWLWLMVPIVVAVCVVFKTIRTPALKAVPRAAGFLIVQVLVFMALAAAGLWLLVELVV